VFEHRERTDKVVKVYLDRENAVAETRAFRVLNRISEVNKEFRSLRADPVAGVAPAVMIDRFEGTLAAYVPKSGAGKERPASSRTSPASAHLVNEWHFRDLLRQFAILHGHGVSHGDAHSGNTGLVVTAAGPRFVIGDPASLSISPLSWVSDVAAEGDAGRVLGILRAHAAGKLSDPMENLDEKALVALLRAGGVDPDKESAVRNLSWRGEMAMENKTNVRIARSFLEEHRLVVDAARHDLVRLMNTMGNIPGMRGPATIGSA
jgi:hypothetical protein